VCFARDQIKDVHYLSVYDDAGRTIFDSQYDVISGNVTTVPNVEDTPPTGLTPSDNGSVYVNDFDNKVRSKGKSAPVCVNFDDAEAPTAAKGISSVSGTSISGHFTPTEMFNYTAPKLLDAMQAQSSGSVGPTSWSGTPSDVDDTTATNGTPTTETFTTGFNTPGTVVIKGTTCAIVATGEMISLTITRGTGSTYPDIDTATGSLTIPTSCGNLTGTFAGEAIKKPQATGSSAGTWFIRGQVTLTGATFAGTGGFTADLATNGTGINSDDTISNVAMDGLSA
jgi:hypothetical protein